MWERERETGEMGFLAQMIESQQMYIHTYLLLIKVNTLVKTCEMNMHRHTLPQFVKEQ